MVVKTTVYLDDKLYERVWDYIREKYPKQSTYGKFKLVVAEALDEFLTKRGVK